VVLSGMIIFISDVLSSLCSLFVSFRLTFTYDTAPAVGAPTVPRNVNAAETSYDFTDAEEVVVAFFCGFSYVFIVLLQFYVGLD